MPFTTRRAETGPLDGPTQGTARTRTTGALQRDGPAPRRDAWRPHGSPSSCSERMEVGAVGWAERLRENMVSADAALAAVQSGSRVFIHGAAATPLPLIAALGRRLPHV